MTRQPDSPLSALERDSVNNMARYLNKLSESRQVMILKCFHKNRIRMAVEQRLQDLNQNRKEEC